MTESDTTDRVDTSDMLVVHTALLREIRLAPAAIAQATRSGNRARRRAGRHVGLILDLLEHHHHGEDELLLPLLRARVPRAALGALDTGAEQHADIEALVAQSRSELRRWVGDGADTAAGPTPPLTDLHAALEPHLRAEEREVLPLAATHLSAGEWEALGEAGFAATPKSALVLVFGMFAYEGDPAVVRSMLASAPAPVRVLLPRIAPRVYARRARQVHGTATL